MDADRAHAERARLLDERDADRRVVELASRRPRDPTACSTSRPRSGSGRPPPPSAAAARSRARSAPPWRAGTAGARPPRRSTSTRTRSASSSESGLLSGSSGTKESTARSVSLSRNTCLMYCSAEKQSTGSRSPQEPCGKSGEHLLPVLAAVLAPLAGRVDHVGLDVEDELVAGERALGRGGLEGGLPRQDEAAAGVAAAANASFKRRERGRGAAQRVQEGAPAPRPGAARARRCAGRERVGARDGLGSAAPAGTRRWRSGRP